MSKRHNRRGSVTLISTLVTALLALTGCAAGGVEPFDISTPAKVRERVECPVVSNIHETLVDTQDDAVGKRRTTLRQWGFDDPDDEAAVNSVILALEGKMTECKEDATPEATATATATVTASPTLDHEVKTWGQLLEVASAELEDAGVNLDEAQQWANLEGADGNPFDARLVLVTEGDLDDEEAREQAGVGAEVPMLAVTDCELSSGEPCPEGSLVVYSPLKEVSDKVEFDPGTGVLFTNNDADLISYDW